jgi:hypothetical protein
VNTGNWIDAGAGAVAVIALLVALWTGKSNQRSAAAAEGAEVTSRQAADAARDSARAAEAAAESAAQVSRAERDRDHEMYRPNDPRRPFGAFHWEPHFQNQAGAPEHHALFFTFTPPRNYRYGGRTTFATGGNGPLVSRPSMILEAGKPAKVHVDTIPAEVFQSQVKELNLEFWPPADGDPGEKWT